MDLREPEKKKNDKKMKMKGGLGLIRGIRWKLDMSLLALYWELFSSNT